MILIYSLYQILYKFIVSQLERIYDQSMTVSLNPSDVSVMIHGTIEDIIEDRSFLKTFNLDSITEYWENIAFASLIRKN